MKKNREKKERVAPRFGVLDAVIILLVILAAVGIYFRYSILEFISGARNLEQYSISYSVNDIRYTTPDFIDEDDTVYFASNGEKLGYIITVADNMSNVLNPQPASKEFVSYTGEIIKASYPDTNSRVDVSGRLLCTGKYSDSGEFLANGSTYIALGQYISIQTDYVTMTIRIDEIELFEEN